MNNMAKYQKYKEQSISVQTAGEQLVLVLEEACVSINKAIMCIENKDVAGSHASLIKAQNIYQYLIDSLDFSFSLSDSLFSLYTFIQERLIEANIKKDAELLKWVLETTTQLKETWKSAERISRTQSAVG